MAEKRGSNAEPESADEVPSLDTQAIDTAAINMMLPPTMTVSLPASPIHDLDDALADDDDPANAVPINDIGAESVEPGEVEPGESVEEASVAGAEGDAVAEDEPGDTSGTGDAVIADEPDDVTDAPDIEAEAATVATVAVAPAADDASHGTSDDAADSDEVAAVDPAVGDEDATVDADPQVIGGDLSQPEPDAAGVGDVQVAETAQAAQPGQTNADPTKAETEAASAGEELEAVGGVEHADPAVEDVTIPDEEATAPDDATVSDDDEAVLADERVRASEQTPVHEDVSGAASAVAASKPVTTPAAERSGPAGASGSTPAVSGARSALRQTNASIQTLEPRPSVSMSPATQSGSGGTSGPITPAGVSALRYQTGAPEPSTMLTAERLLEDNSRVQSAPEGFWQKLLYDASLRRVNLGDSARARARKELNRRIATRLDGDARFVPVLSRKGGVGKTTISTLLGMALADARDDRVIAIDANPDRGTLAERIGDPNGHTVRDIVRNAGAIRGYTEFSRLVARDETRLDVLASDTDPNIAHAFSGDDYDIVADLASRYYSLVLTDCGTGIVHSVMRATLDRADAIVIVSGGSLDEARLASETLTWLESNGYERLVESAVVALNLATSGTRLVRLDEIESHFSSRVRSIVRVPYDDHLAAGSTVHFADLSTATREAARELAALTVEGLAARTATLERKDT